MRESAQRGLTPSCGHETKLAVFEKHKHPLMKERHNRGTMSTSLAMRIMIAAGQEASSFICLERIVMNIALVSLATGSAYPLR